MIEVNDLLIAVVALGGFAFMGWVIWLDYKRDQHNGE